MTPWIQKPKKKKKKKKNNKLPNVAHIPKNSTCAFINLKYNPVLSFHPSLFDIIDNP
jgi:hypothetical protein